MSSPVANPILQLVVFLIGEQHYALPVFSVDRVLQMVALSPLPKLPDVVLGVLNLHGKVIPVLDICCRLGLPHRDYGLTSYLLVARTMRRTVSLPVDQVLGVREVRVEAVTPPDVVLPGIAHVSGIVALSEGLLFIHDLNAFLSLDEEEGLTAALEEMAR